MKGPNFLPINLFCKKKFTRPPKPAISALGRVIICKFEALYIKKEKKKPLHSIYLVLGQIIGSQICRHLQQTRRALAFPLIQSETCKRFRQKELASHRPGTISSRAEQPLERANAAIDISLAAVLFSTLSLASQIELQIILLTFSKAFERCKVKGDKAPLSFHVPLAITHSYVSRS